MKGNIASVFVFFVILDLCAGRVFDEKSDAKREIDGKLNEVITTSKTIMQSAENERKLVSDKGESELIKYLSQKINYTKIEFERDASAVIRTAIVQSKPLSVIYCIRGILYSGNNNISDAQSSKQKEILEIKIKKLGKIDFDVYAVKAILQGVTELVEQAKKKIDQESGTIQEVKKEALRRCESALLLLGEIEVCLHEPILTKEYIKLRQNIDQDLRKMKTELNKYFEQCLGKTISTK